MHGIRAYGPMARKIRQLSNSPIPLGAFTHKIRTYAPMARKIRQLSPTRQFPWEPSRTKFARTDQWQETQSLGNSPTTN